uniref:Uncharacterized protein n=1 Tax=Anopheles farauti TaxID=69004 RepID=A0A182QNZ4_9DIPT
MSIKRQRAKALSACIDDNLDMVEFLVQKGADVNRKDNEGWTPLHATASCGFLSIARYLIENGADLASINSDGELAVDLASSDAMEDLIQLHLDEQGIDCEEARQAEERIMLSDATKWLRTDSADCDKAHPKTGATAIHVAAAKGYVGVLKLLLEGRGDIDRQDVDGWTPLHAAAYWGQKEATQMLLNASADIDIQNYSGQLAIDIAQDDIVPLLKDARKNVKRTKRRPPSHGNRITDNFENNTETPTKVIRVEVKPIDTNKEKEVSSAAVKCILLSQYDSLQYNLPQSRDCWTPGAGFTTAGPVAVASDDDDDDGEVGLDQVRDDEEPQDEAASADEEEREEKDEEEEEETMDDTVEDEELEEEEAEVEEEDEEDEEVEEEEPMKEDVTDSVGVPSSLRVSDQADANVVKNNIAQEQEEEADEEEEEEEADEENGSVSSEPYSSSNPSADSSLTESETDELLPRPVPIISRPTPVPHTAQIVVPTPRGTAATGSTQQPSPAPSSNPPPPTAPWRRQRATPTPVPRQFYEQQEEEPAARSTDTVDYVNLYFTSKRNQVSEKENKPTEPDVILRRTQSFESDEKFYQRYAELRARIQANSCPHTILPSTPINTKTSTTTNNNNSSNNNNNNTTTATATTPASNISSYLVQRSASLKDHRTLRKTTSNLVLGSTTTSPSSATVTTPMGPPSGTPTSVASAGVTTSQANAAGTVSPPTSPSGTPITTPTAGQIRSFIPTPTTTTTNTTLNNSKNITSNNTDNNNGTMAIGDRYRKRFEDQPETAVVAPSRPDSRQTIAPVAPGSGTTNRTDHTPSASPSEITYNRNSATGGAGDTNKNHSLFELNRKYIEQAQKTKINNERNKFLSSLNEKRQQQAAALQEQEQESEPGRDNGAAGGADSSATGKPATEASQKEERKTWPVEEPAEVKLIIPSSAAAAPPLGTPTSNSKLSPGNIFKNFFKSFVPPTRDEESETQRKAHAKRVRETRRSTQGVTLDEIKSAEQLVKKKNATGTGNENDSMASATVTATTTTTTSSSPSPLSSSTSPSFTTTNNNTASINDRVPSVGGTMNDQQQPSGNHIKEDAGKDAEEEEVAVSASFTITAPASSLDDGGDGGGGVGDGGGGVLRRQRRAVSGTATTTDGEEDGDDSKVTVSYTISAPVLRQSSPSPRTSVNNSKESDVVPAVTATFHVPTVSASVAVKAHEPAEGIATTATIRTSSGAAGGVVSSSDSNTTTTTTTTTNTTTSTSSNTNHNNTAATYTKRSLFDIDNANSLTLAEKLRHEANKYAIAAVADGDLDTHHHLPRGPASNSTTNSGVGAESENNTTTTSSNSSGSSTNAPADNSAASAAAAAAGPASPTLRKVGDSTAAATTGGGATAERRPSWRLKVDGGSKFKLEDASTPNAATQSSSVASSGSAYESSANATQAAEHGLPTTKLTSSSALSQRRAQQQQQQQQNGDSITGSTGTSSVAGSRPISGLAAGEQYNRVPGSSAVTTVEPTVTGNSDDTNALLHLRRPPKSSTAAGEENKENDKENDNRSTAQATQAVIQRRRRQKRRSTGVVTVGMEDLDPDRQDSPVDGDEKERVL